MQEKVSASLGLWEAHYKCSNAIQNGKLMVKCHTEVIHQERGAGGILKVKLQVMQAQLLDMPIVIKPDQWASPGISQRQLDGENKNLQWIWFMGVFKKVFWVQTPEMNLFLL